MENKKRKLNNGQEIPLIGLGTKIMMDNKEVVYNSIKGGIRLIDTISFSQNRGIREGIKKALRVGICKREDLCIIGKVCLQNKINPENSLINTLNCLGINYIDIYLDLWPYVKDYRAKEHIEAAQDAFVPISIYEFWRKMEALVEKG